MIYASATRDMRDKRRLRAGGVPSTKREHTARVEPRAGRRAEEEGVADWTLVAQLAALSSGSQTQDPTHSHTHNSAKQVSKKTTFAQHLAKLKKKNNKNKKTIFLHCIALYAVI